MGITKILCRLRNGRLNMSREIKEKTQNLWNHPNAQGLDMTRVAQIMDSPEGKTLLRQLSGPGGDALKRAASQAADGDTGAAGRMLTSLMSTKEGQSLAAQAMALRNK
ncbi:MAG: hypothetical protein FWH04_03715 [Oscillospiraceae bacterium]|nr:hypothetical protein [Oscillospiraceae bacterium]